jgi:hypothetical protein
MRALRSVDVVNGAFRGMTPVAVKSDEDVRRPN